MDSDFRENETFTQYVNRKIVERLLEMGWKNKIKYDK